MNTFADRIREAIWNLRQVPGFKPNEQYDHRIHQPISEAIDLLKEMNAEQVILKATPEQIRNLEQLMESGPGEYSCMPLEDFEAEQNRLGNPGTRILVGNQQESESHQEQQQPRETRHCTAHTTYAPESRVNPERTDTQPIETPPEVTHHPV